LVSDIEKRKMADKNVLAIIMETEADGGMQE
jgi:hypothetical protein